MKKKALVLAVYMACATPNSGEAKALSNSFSGLNLGEVESNSSQGEVFSGIIPILLTSQQQARLLKVRLAPKSIFAQLGAEKKPELDYLNFKIKIHKNKPVIVVSSNQPIHLPVLSFILEIESPKGVIYQVYTVMLKPPKARVKSLPPKIKKPLRSHPKTFISPKLVRNSTIKYKVRSGDTLSIIARRYKHRGISNARMIKSIHSANPKAFIRNDINRLIKGAVLFIPSATNINKFDLITANANAEHRAKKLSNSINKTNKLHTYKVKRGDTLSKVTKKYLYNGVSFTKMMKAIHKVNPHAFLIKRKYVLKAGVRIRIPTYTEVVNKKRQVQNVVKTQASVVAFSKNSSVEHNKEVANTTNEDNLEISAVDKLQKTINKLKRSKISSVTSNTEETEPANSYDSNDLAALYKQAFGKKGSTKKTDKSTSSAETSQSNNLAALYAQAFGKKQSIAAPSKVSVDLRVNKTNVGEITLFSNNLGELDRVKAKSLLKTLKGVLKKHIYKRLDKKFVKNKYIIIKNLATQGIQADYNSVNLSLDLKIKPELRKPRILSLYKKRSISVRKENKIKAEDLSGFINMYSNTNLNLGEKTKPNFKMKLEGSIGLKDFVLESTMDINNTEWRSGKTTLTYDKPDKLQRFLLGDISTGNRNFQENLELLGIRASKEFFMKPELQIRPKANESFIIETDSEVEVFTNNQLRQRFYLQKGVYSLQDIGLNNGENNIKVKITDSFGKVTTKTSQQYYDSHLLKPDLSLYSFSVGYLDNKKFKLKKEQEKTPILSGYYEQGLSKNLTMSLDVQLSSDNYLLGSEAISSFSFGSLKQSVAMSGGKDKKTGFASRFEFKPNIYRDVIELDTVKENTLSLDQKVKHFVNSWTISGEYRNEDFSMISQQESVDDSTDFKQLKGRLQTQFSLDLGNQWRGTVNLGVANYYDSNKKASVDLAATKRFSNGGRLRLGANYDSDNDLSVNLQFSMPLWSESSRSNKNLEVLVNSKDQAYSSKLSLNARSQVGKNSLSGSLTYNHDKNSNRQRLDFHYKDVNYETNINAINSENLTGSNNQQLNIGFNTSIACIGSHCATSYPIDDSFALVSGPSNQEKPVAVKNGYGQFKYEKNNNTLPERYTSVIPNNTGTAVVPLESYQYQNINIDQSALPDGYDSEKTEFEVFPRYHQGFLIKAGGEPATIVSGALIDKQQKILAYKGGQWIPEDSKEKTIAFFSNKIGQFYLNSVPAGKYKLELFDYPDMDAISITIPDKKGKLFELGNIVINTD